MSKMYKSIKKGIEEAIKDANDTTKLKRHTVEYSAIKTHQTEAPGGRTVRLIEKEKE